MVFLQQKKKKKKNLHMYLEFLLGSDEGFAFAESQSLSPHLPHAFLSLSMSYRIWFKGDFKK